MKHHKRGRPIGGKAPKVVRDYWRLAKQIQRSSQKIAEGKKK